MHSRLGYLPQLPEGPHPSRCAHLDPCTVNMAFLVTIGNIGYGRNPPCEDQANAAWKKTATQKERMLLMGSHANLRKRKAVISSSDSSGRSGSSGGGWSRKGRQRVLQVGQTGGCADNATCFLWRSACDSATPW